MNVVWRSESPEALPVYQGGLVVCLRPGAGSVTIQAATPDWAVVTKTEVVTR
jgi:hypothetical protein